MKTIRIAKPADPLQSEIDRRIALKRAAGKSEPVPAGYAVPRAFRAVAAHVRAGVGTVVAVLSEVR